MERLKKESGTDAAERYKRCKERELGFMLKIVIRNPHSETVINNVYPEELDFWKELLDGAVRGDIQVIDVASGQEYQVA